MDVNTLIAEAKARFSHNSAKHYLREKYNTKLIIADQGGLWKADKGTISILSAFDSDTVVIMDTFENPVEVNRKDLLSKLTKLYAAVMAEWLQEVKEHEGKR